MPGNAEIIVLIAIVLWVILSFFLPSSTLKGWFGEKKTTFKMWLSLDAKIYRRFHDVIIPAANGTTQIDHLLVSPYGLFIVETKNIKGWIFGSEDQAKWTMSVYGKNIHFKIHFARLSGKKRSSLNSWALKSHSSILSFFLLGIVSSRHVYHPT
jgi:hypothetical protein